MQGILRYKIRKNDRNKKRRDEVMKIEDEKKKGKGKDEKLERGMFE